MKHSRRSFLKAGTLAGTALAVPSVLAQGASNSLTATQPDSRNLDITIAGYNFDHVQALIDGRVPVDGCNVQFQPGKIGDLNTHVSQGHRPWRSQRLASFHSYWHSRTTISATTR